MLEELGESRERIAELREGLEEKTGESRRLQIRQIQEEELRGGQVAHELAELVIAAVEDAEQLGAARQELLQIMDAGPAGIQRALDERFALLEARRQQRDAAPPEAAIDAQDAVTAAARAVDDVFRFYARHVRLMQKLGLDDSVARQSLTEQLEDRADELSVLAKANDEEIGTLEERLKLNPEDAESKARLVLLNVNQKGTVEALRRMVDLLQELDADTVEYQELLFTFTGDVSDIGLDTEVVTGLLKDWVEQAREWLRAEGWSLVIRVAIVLLILLAAWVLARLVRKFVYKALISGRASMSRLLQSMLAGVAANLVLILGILVALSQLGISIGPMLAGLGIAGFIVGFALQDTLGNFASGVMILIYRPFDEGDVVEAAGINGKVQTMNLVSTTVLTFDNQTLIVPNSKIWGDVIRNVTHQRTRRVDFVFRISRDDDVDMAEEILQDIVAGDERVLPEPEPTIRLHELGDASYDFIVRPWVKTTDYWGVYWDLTREVQRRFAAANLHPPRPQRDIRISAEPGGDGTGEPTSL
ncbi:MAG: mechanosensitive ion channel [Chromatiales bacterium]|nr:MAG: mechanosensitive ion channel [Chromatiales bacterium]